MIKNILNITGAFLILGFVGDMDCGGSIGQGLLKILIVIGLMILLNKNKNAHIRSGSSDMGRPKRCKHN